jgi:hypothetical protein
LGRHGLVFALWGRRRKRRRRVWSRLSCQLHASLVIPVAVHPLTHFPSSPFVQGLLLLIIAMVDALDEGDDDSTTTTFPHHSIQDVPTNASMDEK